VVDWRRTRAHADEALRDAFAEVRRDRAKGRSLLSNADADEAWQLVASSPGETVQDSASHSSGFLLPFVSTSVTVCFALDVASPARTERLAAVISVDSFFGAPTARWKALSARRPCTCATGDDETCKLVDGP